MRRTLLHLSCETRHGYPAAWFVCCSCALLVRCEGKFTGCEAKVYEEGSALPNAAIYLDSHFAPDGQPVLFKGAIKNWPLYKHLKQDGLSYLAKRYGGHRARLQHPHMPFMADVGTYIDQCIVGDGMDGCTIGAVAEPDPLHPDRDHFEQDWKNWFPGSIFDEEFASELAAAGEVEIPNVLNDLAQKQRWFSLGIEGNGTFWHYHGTACFANLYGIKDWLLLDPHTTYKFTLEPELKAKAKGKGKGKGKDKGAEGKGKDKGADEVISDGKKKKLLVEVIKEMWDNKVPGEQIDALLRKKAPAKYHPIRCRQEPGDLICFPAGYNLEDRGANIGWGHATQNEGSTLGIAYEAFYQLDAQGKTLWTLADGALASLRGRGKDTHFARYTDPGKSPAVMDEEWTSWTKFRDALVGANKSDEDRGTTLKDTMSDETQSDDIDLDVVDFEDEL